MAQADVSQLVLEDHTTEVVYIVLRDHNMAKPTEGRGDIIHHGEGHILLDDAHGAAVDQSPHRVDAHGQTCHHKGHANQEDHHGNILQQSNIIDT